MKSLFALLAALFLLLAPALARADDDASQKVATTFPSIDYRIAFFKRITPDRLLLGVQIFATPQASPAGTFIGIPVPIPKNATPEDIVAGRYHPRPLSLASSQMIDDLTEQTYSPLPPLTQNGMSFRPGSVTGTLHPREAFTLTIQFPVPPPPPPPAPAPAPP